MSKRISFGIFLPQLYPWLQMKEEAGRIEALGFDSLWVADHFVSPYSATADWFECWSLLGALAASTERIRLGTGMTHVVYRNPAILARSALTVDHISNGRLDLGMGVGGGGDYNYAMTGTPPQSKGERVGRYREAGIDEFVLGYAPRIDELQGDWMVAAGQLEAYAGVIEELKTEASL